MGIEEVLAAAAMAEQAALLATRLYQNLQAKGDPTPAEVTAAMERAQTAADRFHDLLSGKGRVGGDTAVQG